MDLSTVNEWLAFIGSVHETEIDLGLERVKKVAERLKVLSPKCPVIIVGGTNGKGSTVAGLESVYRAACYRTGVFTSPFLIRYNEQVRIDGEMVEDQALCEAFSAVEAARGDISLTPFEYCTLAALLIFSKEKLDILILEVGLGGRLDAVNIIDADVTVITSIGMDHINWLGDTREKIGHEKAGIFRSKKPVVCGDDDPPVSLIEAAKKLHAPFYQRGRDFHYQETATTWTFQNENRQYDNLPRNHLATQNMWLVIKVIDLLRSALPVSHDAILQGLREVQLKGRIEIVKSAVMEIYDVSHNPDAVAFLSKKLAELPCTGKTHAVFSMLEDKDISGSITKIKDKIDFWFYAPLTVKRAASLELLENSFKKAGITDSLAFPSVVHAYHKVLSIALPGDRIIVFGSFHTVAEILKHKEAN